MNRKNKKLFVCGIIVINLFSICCTIAGAEEKDVRNFTSDEQNQFLKTIIVPDDYPTIKQAINHAVNGDIILVRQGIYKENININKMITIHGDGMDLTTIMGESATDHTVSITADGVEIASFAIKNSGVNKAGVYVSSHYNTIQMNKITNNYYGIMLDASNGNRILDNIIVNNTGIGLWMDSSHMNEIAGNNISDNVNDGVKIDFTSTYNSMTGNIASKNMQNGLLINEASRSNTVAGNKIEANTIGVKCVGTSDNNRFYQNDFHENIEQNAFDTSSDVWNRSSMGNYWSNYDEASEGAFDNNSDGIIDNSFKIPGGDNRDARPLSGPLAPSPPVVEGPISVQAGTQATYHVSTPTEKTYSTVYYQIYWGNGLYWEPTNKLVDTSEGINLSHIWSFDTTYNVRARAYVDIEGVRFYSDISNFLPVKVPTNTNEHDQKISDKMISDIDIIKIFINNNNTNSFNNCIQKIRSFYINANHIFTLKNNSPVIPTTSITEQLFHLFVNYRTCWLINTLYQRFFNQISQY